MKFGLQYHNLVSQINVVNDLNPFIRFVCVARDINLTCLIQGESVLWTWKINDEPHNIIHVTAADSQVGSEFCIILNVPSN